MDYVIISTIVGILFVGIAFAILVAIIFKGDRKGNWDSVMIFLFVSFAIFLPIGFLCRL